MWACICEQMPIGSFMGERDRVASGDDPTAAMPAPVRLLKLGAAGANHSGKTAAFTRALLLRLGSRTSHPDHTDLRKVLNTLKRRST